MTQNYAQSVRSCNPKAGVLMIQKLVKERDKDVSPYNWARTFLALGWNQWQMCDKPAAMESLNEGQRRFPKGWQADDLKKALAKFRQEEPSSCIRGEADKAEPTQ